MNVNDITVVIRSAGERTEKTCLNILKEQISDQNIFLVRERPFSEAVKKTFNIGIEQNRTWTLAVDADILLKENALQEMMYNVQSFPAKILKSLFIYQGYVLCKVFGSPRQAGLHLYQTKFLSIAIDLIPKDSFEQRPESATYLQMKNAGYFHIIDNKLYALHDYEQYYSDLFRKAFFHAKKHFSANFLYTYLSHWQKNISDDPDFKILLAGWTFGFSFDDPIKNDINYFNKTLNAEFKRLKINEKNSLDFETDKIFKYIQNELDHPGKTILSRRIEPQPKPTFLRKIKRKTKRIIKCFFSD